MFEKYPVERQGQVMYGMMVLDRLCLWLHILESSHKYIFHSSDKPGGTSVVNEFERSGVWVFIEIDFHFDVNSQ